MTSPTLKFIGHLKTPYKTPADCPGQARPENGVTQIVVDEAYADGLTGLKEGGHIQVMYWFDRADRTSIKRVPKWSRNGEERGVFSIRSPHRPNPIALSTVEIHKIERNVLTVTAMDAVDGTALLDIKPYLNQLAPKS